MICRNVIRSSECTPSPISGYAIRDRRLLLLPAFDVSRGGAIWASGGGATAGAIAIVAVLPMHAAGRVPSLELFVTGLACSNLVAVWVELSGLIKWDYLVAVCRTKHMATVSTVMLAHKETKVGATGGRITAVSQIIWLPVICRGRSSDVSEFFLASGAVLKVVVVVRLLSRVVG